MKKIHLVSWETVSLSKKDDSLGIQKTKTKNGVMLMSLSWRFNRNHENQWFRILKSKYSSNGWKCTPHASATWRNFFRGWKLSKGASTWIVRNRDDFNFWIDR